ncbi:hypothetical protein ACOME3_002159 [Neoechinorhynchus agilis]
MESTPNNDKAKMDKCRFEAELDFVQCLANPRYLHFLARNGFFKSAAFMAYVEYLKYWTTEPYLRFIKYPLCLDMLKLLTSSEQFKENMEVAENVAWLNQKLVEHSKERTELQLAVQSMAVNGDMDIDGIRIVGEIDGDEH